MLTSSQLLDTILAMLRTVKDDRVQLEKLYEFMVHEIYNEEKEEELKVPEKYRVLVKEVAEWVGAAMICYINPATLELVWIPSKVLDEIGWDDELENEEEDALDDYADYRKDLKRIAKEWKNTITVSPPKPHDTFRFMERFVSSVTDPKLSRVLSDALHRSKPFRNFNAIIHESAGREAWFSFRQKCLEEYVFGEIQKGVKK